MNIEKPFIHLLQTPYGKYVFDVNMDRIYKIEDSIFNVLKNTLENKEIPIDEESIDDIKHMQEDGLLKSKRPKVMKHPASDFMDYYLSHKIGGITLQLTQNCNFRCEYCVYGQESPLNRSHSKNKILIETAKKAVDFLLIHSRDTEVPNIGFYGGEPLLEFELLKEIVLYAKEVFIGREVTFNMTSNGSLINRNIMDFLVKHSIRLLISLDGPKEIHDSKRKFAVNGCGTFDIIMKKLNFIRTYYPEYYKSKIGFSVVLDPSKEYDCINQMFINSSLLKDTSTVTSIIDDSYAKEKNHYSEQFIQQKKYDEFLIFLYEIGRIRIDNLTTISRRQIEVEEKLSNAFGKYSIYDEMSHGGPCIVASKKVFVDVHGNLFPCEKVSESSPVMNIGHIDTGFNIGNINKLMNIAQLTEKACKECWAINRCLMCPKLADDGNRLCTEKKLQQCGKIKKSIEFEMLRHLALKEILAGGNI